MLIANALSILSLMILIQLRMQICEKWTEEHIASEYPQLDSHCLQQVKACIKIGLECVEIDPDNRPSIDKIVDELNKRDV